MYRRNISCNVGTAEGIAVLLCLYTLPVQYTKEYVQKNYILQGWYCGGSSCAALPVQYMKKYVQQNYILYCRYCRGSSCAALFVHEGVCTEELYPVLMVLWRV